VFDFLAKFFGRPSSGATAKERLRLVLLSDHLSLSPDVVDALKHDLIELISRYVEVDVPNCDVTFEHRDKEVAMLANIPILSMNKRPTPPPAPPVPPSPPPSPERAPEPPLEPAAAIVVVAPALHPAGAGGAAFAAQAPSPDPAAQNGTPRDAPSRNGVSERDDDTAQEAASAAAARVPPDTGATSSATGAAQPSMNRASANGGSRRRRRKASGAVGNSGAAKKAG
jgi:cell division topological specificity factor